MGVQIELSEASLLKPLKQGTQNDKPFRIIKALKISWFRRVIQNSKNIEWYSLSKIDFTKFFSCGPGYSVELSKNLHKRF